MGPAAPTGLGSVGQGRRWACEGWTGLAAFQHSSPGTFAVSDGNLETSLPRETWGICVWFLLRVEVHAFGHAHSLLGLGST